MVNHFWELLKCFELVVISQNCWHVGRTDLWLKETRSIACSCIGYQRKAPCRWLEGRRHGRVHSASSILLPTVKGGRENPVIHRQHQFLWLSFSLRSTLCARARPVFSCVFIGSVWHVSTLRVWLLLFSTCDEKTPTRSRRLVLAPICRRCNTWLNLSSTL